MCDGTAKRPLNEFTREVAEQCWAELRAIWEHDKDLLPSKASMDAARELQAEHTEGSEKFGLVQNYLETKLPERWKNMTILERKDWLAGETSIEGEGVIERDRVCVMEVWCECFGYNPEKIRNLDAREINTILQNMPGWAPHKSKSSMLRFDLYGRQRAYTRVSPWGEQEKASTDSEKASTVSDDFLDDLM
jgi:hypothetical protein